jgi:N-acetylmuramoyl-L-alanine amidase
MAKIRVLVQAGHLAPREPGHDGATGTVDEQKLTFAVRDRLCSLLNQDGRFTAIPVPGNIPDGINVDAAIFLHGDGAANKSASGYCFGYPNYAVNKKLANMIGENFDLIPGHPKHRTDNYTADLRGYYGFGKVKTDGPEVLVEHGFLTNPAEHDWLFSHIDELAHAEYAALLEYFKVPPKPRPGYKPPWTVRQNGKIVANGRFSNPKFVWKTVSFLRRGKVTIEGQK